MSVHAFKVNNFTVDGMRVMVKSARQEPYASMNKESILGMSTV